MELELWEYLKTAKKPIVLYGMGNGADKIIKVLEENEIKFKGIFASDGFKQNKIFHGVKVESYSSLKEKFGDMIVLLCFGSALPQVIENILRIASDQELYAPEVPVIGGGLFTMQYYLENKPEFDRIYSLLADDISRKTFLNIINYKISGKINYLTECEVSPNQPYETFFKLTENETFLDLGAYNGDTVLEFVSRVGTYKKIVAVEPDTKTFRKLKNNTEHLENIELINTCISDKCKTVNFSMSAGRNSAVQKDGTPTNCISVDSLNLTPTFIKMDVEGEEVAAITGAKETILKSKPKMLISAYHRTDDFLKLPKAVLDIRDDYKIYLRHYPYLPAWDTNFYFV